MAPERSSARHASHNERGILRRNTPAGERSLQTFQLLQAHTGSGLLPVFVLVGVLEPVHTIEERYLE